MEDWELQKALDNRMRWDGRNGFYEVWYAKWNDRASRTAGWVRYTLTSPSDWQSGDPVVELWGMFFDAADPARNFAAKSTYPASMLSAPGDRFTMPDGAIGGRITGRVRGRAGRDFRWDLSITSSGPPFRHLPWGWMYRAPFPTTKALSPHQDARLTGTVEIDGRVMALDQAPGQQAHIWGTRHAQAWAWGHCNDFPGADAVWEGLDSRVKVGPFTSPRLPLFFLRLDGREYRFTGGGAMLRNRSRWEVGSWDFTARSGEWALEGEARVRPEDLITVTYTDPDGRHLWCRNSKVGSLRLVLRCRGKKNTELFSPESAAVEFVTRQLGSGERVFLE